MSAVVAANVLSHWVCFAISGAMHSVSPGVLGVYGLAAGALESLLYRCKIPMILFIPLGYIGAYYIMAAFGTIVPISAKIFVTSIFICITTIVASLILIGSVFYYTIPNNQGLRESVSQIYEIFRGNIGEQGNRAIEY